LAATAEGYRAGGPPATSDIGSMATANVRAPVVADYPRNYPRNARRPARV
jgi:hypothetical protein